MRAATSIGVSPSRVTDSLGVEMIDSLERSGGQLQDLACRTELEIGLVTKAFEGLAGCSDTMLNIAARIVGCVEDESVRSVLAKVQTLGAEAKRFVSDRLNATTGLLAVVTEEVELLRELSGITRGQEAIVGEINAFSVLTKTEVARLGDTGANFLYLAGELADFSKSFTADTRALASHTDGRKVAIEETRRVLAVELPRLQNEFSRIEAELGAALAVFDSSLNRLLQTPAQFRGCVKDIAGQIAGVVTAIQVHDVTRQQVEHVRESLALVAGSIRASLDSQLGVAAKAGEAYAGLKIQSYQLRSVRSTVATWATQVGTCMAGIHEVSASEVMNLGPLVLEQERLVVSQLAHMELLERESERYSERIQRTFGGLSNLVQLVGEHLERSKAIRNRLRLLTFNSIIEGRRLGSQAAAVLAISQSIKATSAGWGELADQSGRAMEKILTLVQQTNQVMETFSPASTDRLRDAQVQTKSGLGSLRTAAVFAEEQAREMKSVTANMHATVAGIGNTGTLFDASLANLDTVLAAVEALMRQLEIKYPEAVTMFDAEQVEKMFSSSYTTEMERLVLQAALRGEKLPESQSTFAGNVVELF